MSARTKPQSQQFALFTPGPHPGCDCESCLPEPVGLSQLMLADNAFGPDACDRCAEQIPGSVLGPLCLRCCQAAGLPVLRGRGVAPAQDAADARGAA